MATATRPGCAPPEVALRSRPSRMESIECVPEPGRVHPQGLLQLVEDDEGGGRSPLVRRRAGEREGAQPAGQRGGVQREWRRGRRFDLDLSVACPRRVVELQAGVAEDGVGCLCRVGEVALVSWYAASRMEFVGRYALGLGVGLLVSWIALVAILLLARPKGSVLKEAILLLPDTIGSVSYTHLTLPTKRIV